ncbi:MAG: SDR family oxidoreductase, partial [candidate division KSB1 bacterium]|nr:SDR family oxidoreductase [candidate division KSB1 bacterium]
RIGQAIVLALAGAGYNVVVHYRTFRPAVEDTLARAEASGADVLLYQADLSHPPEAEQLLLATIGRFGHVDVLVANAGAFERTPVEQCSEAVYRRMLDDNLFAALWVARAFGVWMRDHGSGSIVALADVAALRPWRGYLAYNVAKAGVVAAVRTLAKDLAPAVRVNAIAPGPILFPPGFPPEQQQREIDRTLLKRAGAPEHIADAVLFLCRNNYVTGVVLPVDGGRLLAGDDGY